MKALIKLVVMAASLVTLSGLVSADAQTDKIVERVKPVSTVCVAGDPCASAAPAPAAAAARGGEEVFNAVCTGCHSTGAAGAPKIGDKDAWAPRIAQGEDTLLQHALNGFNVMPPKGGCGNCSDEEIRNAMEYMVSKSQ